MSGALLKSTIQGVVEACARHPWPVIAVAVVLTLASILFGVRHFAINTDVNELLSPNLPWRQQQLAYDRLFPQDNDLILAVVEAPTPELAEAASNALVQRLSAAKGLFHSIQQPGHSAFFRQNGLLFEPVGTVQRTTSGLTQARLLIATLARDPSLRGVARTLQISLGGIKAGRITLADMAHPLSMGAATIEHAIAGEPAHFSWQALMAGHPPAQNELRRLIAIRPILNFSALEPGKRATDAIRKAVAALDLAGHYQARVRLTGPVPISDEEFASVQEGALTNSIATAVIVLVILWLALRSPKIILAVFLNLMAGLAMTAALGLMLVGAFNLISVAFFVLFVGLGVDFAIQFSVRYRTERHNVDNLQTALSRAARSAGVPLTLAATAVAAGFLSFLPTDYRGVSELGQIAGLGMLIAFITTLTLLPALLSVLNPPGEPEPLGYAALAPVDRFLVRRRVPIIAGTLLLALAGTPLLFMLRFDFNPLDLRNPHTEAVSTLRALQNDPALGYDAINVIEPSLPKAEQAAQRLKQLPQVTQATTLASFVPDYQSQKLHAIKAAQSALAPLLSTKPVPPPTDAEIIAALRTTAAQLNQAADAAGSSSAGAAAPARRLAAALTELASATPDTRARVQAVFVTPLNIALTNLRDLLKAEPITLETLPDTLIKAWTTADGRARVELVPKGDAADTDNLRKVARAVLAVAPTATGGPVAILFAAETMIHAFVEAGIWALLSIALLLWMVLRRIDDVLLTLVPLLLAGVVTLEIWAAIGETLNFANIIALPVLLGIGVAFKIYYMMAWRNGQTNLLQSSLTRAVIWSALTTATAFGSLWLSSHPGTSSMGKLLALSLVTTLCAAVLFQPALMGPPRSARGTPCSGPDP